VTGGPGSRPYRREHRLNSDIDTGPSPPAGRYIAECGHILGAALPRLLEALFDKVDDALNDQADRSTNGRLAGLYLGAADRVHQSRSGIRSEFLRRVRFAAEQTALGRAGLGDLGDALGVRLVTRDARPLTLHRMRRDDVRVTSFAGLNGRRPDRMRLVTTAAVAVGASRVLGEDLSFLVAGLALQSARCRERMGTMAVCA